MIILRAATVGDVDTVIAWLSAPPNTRHPTQTGLVLAMAVRYGHDSICQLMLDSGQMTDSDVA